MSQQIDSLLGQLTGAESRENAKVTADNGITAKFFAELKTA